MRKAQFMAKPKHAGFHNESRKTVQDTCRPAPKGGEDKLRANQTDSKQLAKLVMIIWPEHSAEELERIIREYLGSDDSAVFCESRDGKLVGVALCTLRRDYVEGCKTSPVGYLEGVSVNERYRRRGIARKLVSECEQWAREKGCCEFASDCELANRESLIFHLGVGFQEENRIICFRKTL